jgi:hypothetical protein
MYYISQPIRIQYRSKFHHDENHSMSMKETFFSLYLSWYTPISAVDTHIIFLKYFT